jgi:hypothetical protein
LKATGKLPFILSPPSPGYPSANVPYWKISPSVRTAGLGRLAPPDYDPGPHVKSAPTARSRAKKGHANVRNGAETPS